jgi:hypothetical protein
MLSDTTMAEIRRATRIEAGGEIADPICLSGCDLRVQVIPIHAASNGLEPGTTYKISTVAGVEGEDAFMRLRTLDGEEVPRWHRATELTTAPAAAASRMPPMDSVTEGEIKMNNAAADRFQKRVTELAASGERWAKAIEIAAHEDEIGATAYHLSGIGRTGAATDRPVFTLSATVEANAASGADFDALVGTFQAETNCTWAHAVHVVGARFPRLAERR